MSETIEGASESNEYATLANFEDSDPVDDVTADLPGPVLEPQKEPAPAAAPLRPVEPAPDKPVPVEPAAKVAPAVEGASAIGVKAEPTPAAAETVLDAAAMEKHFASPSMIFSYRRDSCLKEFPSARTISGFTEIVSTACFIARTDA